MKRILAFLLDFGRGRIRRRTRASHNDSLRASRFNDSNRTFSFWRALVS